MPERSPLTSAMNTGTPMRLKRLGEHLEGDGLAGAGRAGDQAVTVGHLREQGDVPLALRDQDGVRHLSVRSTCSRPLATYALSWYARDGGGIPPTRAHQRWAALPTSRLGAREKTSSVADWPSRCLPTERADRRRRDRAESDARRLDAIAVADREEVATPTAAISICLRGV